MQNLIWNSNWKSIIWLMTKTFENILLRIFWVENILYARAFLIPFKRESWNWTLRKITSCTCRIKLFMCISFKTRDCTERILMNRNYQTQIIYALNNISKHQPLPFGRQTIITIQEVSENLCLSRLYGLSRMRHGWYQKNGGSIK